MLFLENNFKRLGKLNTVAFGLGVDSVPSNKAWADSMKIKNTRLLSDFWPHGEVAKKYDVFNKVEGYSNRANIIIDESRKVIFAKEYSFYELPDIEELIHFIEYL
jgi:peroxiredoxin